MILPNYLLQENHPDGSKVVIFVTFLTTTFTYTIFQDEPCVNHKSKKLDIIEPCIQLVVNPSTVAQPELHRHRPRKKWKWHAVKPFLV